MASTPRAVPTDTAAAVPSSPAASPKGQARHNRKKQKRGGGSNNGSHTRSSMCEAPEAKWPGSTAAPDRQLTPASAEGLQLQPAALANSSGHSDGASRCPSGNSQCSCDSSSSAAVGHDKAASDASGDAANGSSGSRSSNKHSAGQGSAGSRQQRRHGAGSAAAGSGQAAGGGGGGGCSGSGNDGDDDHQDAWRRRKVAAGRGVHKQQHKPQEQQPGQHPEDGVALDTDARQQQAQQQEAAVCKLQDSRSGSPPQVNGYVKGHGPKPTHRQQSPDIQLQALSIQHPGAEPHGWVPIQFGDLPVLLGASPDSSPSVTSHSGSRGSRGKGSHLQTIVSMPGIHHSISSGCVVGGKEHVFVQQQQQQRSRSAESKQQHMASNMMTAAELASLALTAATNALTVSPRADKQCDTGKPQNGRTLHLQLEQLQQQGKGSALVNGRYSSSKAAQLPQEQQRSPQPVGQQQQHQSQIPNVSSNGVPQLQLPQQQPQQQQQPQHAQLQQQQQEPVAGGPNNGSCPVTPLGEVGHVAATSKGDLPAPRSPQLSPALLEQFGLRVGSLNGGLLPNELQLRAAIEQAGVGAVLVVREDQHVLRQGADELSNGSSSSGVIAVSVIAEAAGGNSNTSSTAQQGSSSAPAPRPVPAAAGAGGADGNAAASSSKDSRGASSGQRSPHAGRSLPAASPTKGRVPTDSSAGSSKGHRNTGNSSSSPRSTGGKQSSRNPQQHGQQQQQQQLPPVQLQVQVPDAGVDDCSIASSSSSIQASSSTSNPWQQHESAVAVLQLGAGPGAHHAAGSGSISARSHGHGVFGPGLGGLHPQQLYAGSVAGGMSHSSSPHLSHHMDQSDIMSDPGTVPGGGFGLGEGFGGGYSRMKPGRNRFMPNHHLGGGAGYYASGAGSGRHHLQDQPLLMQQFGNGGGGRGGSGGSRRGGGGSRDGDGASGRGAGSGSSRDGDGGGSGRRGGGNSGGRRNSGKDVGLPRSPQLLHGAGSNRRSFDNRGGPYGGGQDGSSRGSGRQTPLPSPGSRSNREQRDHNNSARDVPSPHLAGSSSSNSLAGHPSPLLLPEPALATGPGSGRGGSSGGIAPMQDLPPSATAAAGLPPHGPPTDLERFLAATGPTVPVNPSLPLQQVLKDLTLKSVWDLFLEPSLCGTPIGTLGGPRGPSTAYYVPYMSAMQLFTAVAVPSPSPSPPPPPASASSAAAASSTAAANSSSGSDGASSRSSSSSGSPTPSSCSGASSSTQSYASVAAGASPAPSAANAGSAAARSPSAAAAAAAAAAASSSVQVGPGGRGRLYTCAVKGWPPVMRLLLEHMEQELPFSRDPFYIQLEAMSGGQEAVEAAVAAAAAAASSNEAVSNSEGAGGPAAAAAATSNGAPPAAGNARPTTPAVAGTYTACGYPLVGPDLMTTRLLDIHPASWFAVAWYPVYRIPDAPLTARFLTFYSFAQLLEVLNDAVSAANADLNAPCNLAGLPMPVVGMKWYNLLKERWLELLGTPGNGQQAMVPGGGRRGGNAAARAAAASNNNSDSDQPAPQLLRMHPVRFKEWQIRLEDLQVQAGRLSKGGGLKVLTPQGPKEVRLYHSDYEFFNSRP